jgi:uncharacterized phage protein (TIGR01671 family)
MNREFKFRVWDNVNKEMVYFDFQKLLNTNAPWVLALKFGAMDVMQFTGLHDKNGKEIYEGDILEIDWPLLGEKIPGWVVVWEKNNCLFCIPQCETWMLKRPNKIVRFGVGQVSHLGEIIGNIYEHPHLLATGGGMRAE